MSSDLAGCEANPPGNAHRYWKAAISHLAPEKQADAWSFYMERLDGAAVGGSDTLAGVLLLMEAHLAFFEAVPQSLVQASDGIARSADRIEAACNLSAQDTLAVELRERAAEFFVRTIESPLADSSKAVSDAVGKAENAIAEMTRAAAKARALWRINRLYLAAATLILALGFGTLLSTFAWFWLRSGYDQKLASSLAEMSRLAVSNQGAFKSLLLAGKELTVRPLRERGKVIQGKYELLISVDAPEQAALAQEDAKFQVRIIFESDLDKTLRDMNAAAHH
jgi:hypothetical protein